MDKSLNSKTVPESLVASVSGSALIAQYLGFKQDEKYPTLWIIKDQINQNGNNHFWEGNLKYNESWDWLMPVVEKICAENYDDGENVYLRTFGMIDDNGYFMVRFNRNNFFAENSLIEATFKAVVDYLRTRV